VLPFFKGWQKYGFLAFGKKLKQIILLNSSFGILWLIRPLPLLMPYNYIYVVLIQIFL